MAAPRLVGVIPAAGLGRRLGLTTSKEILPIGQLDATGRVRLRAVCESLLESMAQAGVQQVFVVLRAGKWDIPAFLADGSRVGLPLAYLVVPPTPGVPHTVAAALPFVRGALVAFGFPDILLPAGSLFAPLVARVREAGADVACGLFPFSRPGEQDVVGVDMPGAFWTWWSAGLAPGRRTPGASPCGGLRSASSWRRT